MRLHELCIKRPVFTIVLSTVVTLLGLIGLRLIGVREYPAIDSPVISINANYTGANAEAIEAQITEPIEEAVNTVAGVKSLTSTSRDGASRIRVEFELGVDLDAAANDVRDQVGRAVRLLPRDVDPPFITKADADGGTVLTYVLRSNGRDLMSLTDVADRVKEQLQTIAQVGAVDILGEKRYAMKLRLDPDRMAAHGLTALDVQSAVRRESVELPGGRIENRNAEMTVQAVARLGTPEQFNRMAVLTEGDQVVRFGDIGVAELAPLNERISFTLRGVPMVGLALRAQPGANQIAIADEANRRLDALKASLPEDVTLEVASDNTRFVRHAITELRETILLALVLVVGVIYLFLGSWRATLVPAVVIPISLVGAFFVMHLCGFSLNVLTLLGLVLAVGLVVDDAIVVVENVHRKQEEGLAPLEAGAEGTREVFVAVIATSLALISVFSPIVFLQGATGRLFREFGLVIASSVAISAFVALTLTPMMAARMGHHNPAPTGWLARNFNSLVQAVRAGYRRSLLWFLPRRWLTAAVLAGSFGLIALIYGQLPSELAPLEDRNRVSISATGPEGASYEYMLSLMEGLARRIDRETPEAALINCQVPASGARSGTGVANTGMIELVLKPKADRAATQQEIAERLTKLTRRTPGARFSISQEPSVGDRRGGNSVQFVLRASTLEELRAALPAFLEAAENEPALASVDTDLKFTRPELQVRLDRERLHTMGISATEVAQTLQTSLGAQRVGYFNREGRQYEVVQQIADEYRTDPSILSQLSVHAAGRALVTLDNLVEVGENIAAPQRYRFNRQIAATVTGRLATGTTLEQGIAAMKRAAEALPPGVNTALTGGALEFVESRQSLLYSFGLALAFVFLVLAAQFESWRAPFVIMLTVPLALAGALLALWCSGQSINIFSQIGMIMLVGLVTKNGILLVEFAQQRQHAGVAPHPAVLEAADLRLRPILMTTIATILGVLPIALALGAGAESRVSMGIGVIGGLVVGTALTLYVVPSVYLLVSRKKQMATEALAAVPHQTGQSPCLNPST